MEQRPLRLGDVVDDYCPRERRVTNHAVVAIVDDAVRQTRCTTCDAEHAFKGGQEPRRRLQPRISASSASQPVPLVALASLPESSPAVAVSTTPDPLPSAPPPEPPMEAWTHRRLIRATLPKVEGEVPTPRPIPEFTMHQRPPSRGGRSWRPDGHGRGFEGPMRTSRPFQGNGRETLPDVGDDEDEINGNVAGPPTGRHVPAGQTEPPSARRRRGRRRRGR